VPGKTAEQVLCLGDSNSAGFVNLDASNSFAAPTFDGSIHNCSLPSLSVISLGSAL
jgi:hypothetical protein